MMPQALDWQAGFERLGLPFVRSVPTTPLPQPTWLAYSARAAALIGAPATPQAAYLDWLAGNRALNQHDELSATDASDISHDQVASPATADGSIDSVSSVYSGHQFGVWAGQLGDGRAHLLGTVRAAQGAGIEARSSPGVRSAKPPDDPHWLHWPHWEVQLKGSGRTPYSRMGDGRAVLRSSLREFLASEHLAALGIPTTRALCVIGSPQPVLRESVETAAVTTRLAPSFVRFGHFEHFASIAQHDAMHTLLRHVIETFFPDHPTDAPTLLRLAVQRTARLLAHWQTVGFCHGVMNTDNMSILGLTLDYGPFGFMERFDPAHVCNHSDEWGRYAYHRQPSVALWNLHRLAVALAELSQPDALMTALEEFGALFERELDRLYRRKLGLLDAPRDEDDALLRDWLAWLASARKDYTLSFHDLSLAVQREELSPTMPLFSQGCLNESAVVDGMQWLTRYRQRLAKQAIPGAEVAQVMLASNPAFVLRNWVAQAAIDAAQVGQLEVVQDILQLCEHPFDAEVRSSPYAATAPAHMGGLSVSCSS